MGPGVMDATETSENSNYALKRISLLLDSATVGPDRKLPTERALCEMLQVGRRAVRRALDVLEAEGRIWRRQGSGTFAGPARVEIILSLDAVAKQSSYMELVELRLRIEPEFAALAATRANIEDVARLRNLVSHITESRDADERELWDSALHRTVAQIAGNRLYLAIFDLIDRVRQEAAWVVLRERARSTSLNMLYAKHHDAVVDAIAAGDGATAAMAMRAHLQLLQTNLGRVSVAEVADAS